MKVNMDDCIQGHAMMYACAKYQCYKTNVYWELTKTEKKQKQEDHDGPISLTWAIRFAYLLLKIQPSSLL